MVWYIDNTRKGKDKTMTINYKNKNINLDELTATELDNLFNEISELADYVDPATDGKAFSDSKLADSLNAKLVKITKAENY